MHELRNRVVHHESLLTVDLLGRREDLLAVAKLLDADLYGFILATSTLPELLAARPAS